MNSKVTDLSTIGGIIIAFILVVIAISIGGNILAFIDIASVLIVIMGTYALTMACTTFSDLIKSQILVGKTMFYESEHPPEVATRSLEVAVLARKKGILGLQQHMDMVSHNPFFKRSIEMVVDGTPEEEVAEVMQQEVQAMLTRHSKASGVLRKAAEISPAMGLIGTLIGLIQMLGRLDDPSTIGPAMALALLTTLYGAMLSYMVFSPLASKLERNSKKELLIMQLYQTTAESIAAKENPRRLEMSINAILPPAQRVHYFD